MLPKLIKNLIYIHKFIITDNHVFITFDSFGFSMKDLHMKRTLMRCDSQGDLYSISDIQPPSNSHSSFAALTSTLWHDHLGYLGTSILENKILFFVKK